MHEHSDTIGSVASFASYWLGLSLFVGDLIQVLDHHAGAAGGLIAILTYLTNVAFKFYDRRNTKS